MNPDNPNLRSDAESNLIQKLESELAQAKEELTQVIKIGVEGQREINRKAHSENTKLKEALNVLRDAVEVLEMDCGDNSCRFVDRSKPMGMRTNGGCRCVRNNSSKITIHLLKQREAIKKADEILEGK